jgi:hypothetical protein
MTTDSQPAHWANAPPRRVRARDERPCIRMVTAGRNIRTTQGPVPPVPQCTGAIFRRDRHGTRHGQRFSRAGC